MRRREAGCEAGWINWPVRSESEACGVVNVLHREVASTKHARSGRNWASHYNGAWLRRLGVYSLTGTVRYGSAHAKR